MDVYDEGVYGVFFFNIYFKGESQKIVGFLGV